MNSNIYGYIGKCIMLIIILKKKKNKKYPIDKSQESLQAFDFKYNILYLFVNFIPLFKLRMLLNYGRSVYGII